MAKLNFEAALLDALDPARILQHAGIEPDPWQLEILRGGSKRILMLCARQVGKSTTAAALSLHEATYRPGSLILLVSPSMRQSQELFRKVLDLWRGPGHEGVAAEAQSLLRLELLNKSRILSLPGMDSGTIRGYSGVSLVVIDESAHVSDDLYAALRPMLAVSRGRLVCLGTPYGKRGWFYREWSGQGEWLRITVTADECRRIEADFLEEERHSLGEIFFAQEYMCEFVDTNLDLFDLGLIQDAIMNGIPNLELAT